MCAFAHLPRSFKIPTPVGDFAPDWAIAFNEGAVKHIFFVAETKGSLQCLNLKGVEKAKISALASSSSSWARTTFVTTS